MKQAPPPPRPLQHSKRLIGVPVNKFTKSTVYFIIMLSCYFLGYLTAPSNTTQPDSPTRPIIQEKAITIPKPDPELDHNQFLTHCANPVSSTRVRQTIIDRVFNGSSPWQNFPPAHVRPLIRPRRIKGWGSKGAVFENLVREVRPRVIIEVGSFLGASALHMAGLTQKLGLHDTQIVCIDDFRGWPGFQESFKEMKMMNGDVLLMHQFMQNVVRSKATESIMLMPFSTSSALDKLCEWGVFGDLVEVDAAHDFHSAWSDINRAHKVLRPGGVLFGHDYFTSADNRGVKRAVNLFARLNDLHIQIDGQHWVLRFPSTKNDAPIVSAQKQKIMVEKSN